MENNPDWEAEEKKKYLQAWKKIRSKIDGFDLLSENDVNELTQNLTLAPRDVQEPVWTRWQLMIATNTIMLDNWMISLFLVIGTKLYFPADSHAWKLGVSLVLLMNERAAYEPAASEPIAALPTAATLTTTETELDVPKPRDSPTFYAMLLFHRGFCEYMFNDHFDFLKKNDQYFGPGTFG